MFRSLHNPTSYLSIPLVLAHRGSLTRAVTFGAYISASSSLEASRNFPTSTAEPHHQPAAGSTNFSKTTATSLTMAPVVAVAESERVGPHPSYIEIAKPYILQSRVQKCLTEIHMSDAKEDAVRLQGVAWIDQVRRALQLPIRTFNTAVIYYHKFRLLHSDNEYNWADASAAALFTACKIEDTLKKSREILCANWNLKVGSGESLSSDDPVRGTHKYEDDRTDRQCSASRTTPNSSSGSNDSCSKAPASTSATGTHKSSWSSSRER